MWSRPIVRFSYCQIDWEKIDIDHQNSYFGTYEKRLNISHLHTDVFFYFWGNCLKCETEICIFWVKISVCFVCLSRQVCKHDLEITAYFSILSSRNYNSKARVILMWCYCCWLYLPKEKCLSNFKNPSIVLQTRRKPLCKQ